MFKHILVPLDGSPTSLHALGQAIALAQAFGSDVTALFVIDPYPFSGVGVEFAYGQTEYLQAANAEARQAITAAKAQLDAAGLRHSDKIIEAHLPWQCIAEQAGRDGVDLIVMGSHGRSGLEKLVLGSTTQRVLAHVTVPVMVVRGASGSDS